MQGAPNQPQIFEFYRLHMRLEHINWASHWSDHSVCDLSPFIWSSGIVSVLLCHQYHQFRHHKIFLGAQVIESHMSTSSPHKPTDDSKAFQQFMYYLWPTPLRNTVLLRLFDTTQKEQMDNSSTSSTVNVHDPAMHPEVPLCEMLTFRSACCVPAILWVLFHITVLHLQKLSKNYKFFVWLSLESCYLPKFCLNKSQLHGAIRQCTFQLWQRLSNADKLWTAKCPNYCHLGFRPQSLNKFWKGLKEPFYAQSEGLNYR